MIRIISIAAFAFAVFTVLAIGPRPAQAYGNAPWCAVTNEGQDVHWDCQYASIEQCYPNVIAGNRGFCNQNPAYEGPAEPRRKAARRHRARNY
jgi:hypothetical protein